MIFQSLLVVPTLQDSVFCLIYRIDSIIDSHGSKKGGGVESRGDMKKALVSPPGLRWTLGTSKDESESYFVKIYRNL